MHAGGWPLINAYRTTTVKCKDVWVVSSEVGMLWAQSTMKAYSVIVSTFHKAMQTKTRIALTMSIKEMQPVVVFAL